MMLSKREGDALKKVIGYVFSANTILENIDVVSYPENPDFDTCLSLIDICLGEYRKIGRGNFSIKAFTDAMECLNKWRNGTPADQTEEGLI